MALSSIALCSRALLKLGAGSIASFDEGTAEAEIAANLYGHIRDSVVSAHPWSFATGQTVLARLSAEPVADYAYAFQLPADFLRALSVGVGERGRGTDYRIAERRLHANTPDAVLTYIFLPDESEFPPFFDQVLIQRLSAEFCIPLSASCWWDPSYGSPTGGDASVIATVFTDDGGDYWLHRVEYLEHDPALVDDEAEAVQMCRQVTQYRQTLRLFQPVRACRFRWRRRKQQPQ